LFYALVAAIDVIDAIDHRFALSGETGNDETGRRPQITRHDRSALELLHAGDDGSIALDIDVRTHTVHSMGLNHAVLKHCFDHGASALGDSVERSELRLHIRRKARVRRRAHIDCAGTAPVHVELDPVVAAAHLGPRLLQLEQYCLESVRAGIFELDAPAGCGCGDPIGAGLDAVGHHRVDAAVQALNALDDNALAAVAFYLGAHRDQALREIDNLGLA